jgi:hypothetical protein
MRSFPLITAGALMLGSAFAVAGGVYADDAPVAESPAVAPVAAATTTVTLPLLGAPLTIDLTTDAGGGLLDVLVDEAAAGTPTARSGKVSFVNDGSGVRVTAKKGGQRVEARAGSIGDIAGPGSWSGDLFETGGATTVAFTVVDNGGAPDITGVSVVPDPVGIVATIGDTTYGDDDHDDGDGESEQSASTTITFEYLGQTRTMRIKAEVETDDGGTSAELKISLSRIKGDQQAEGAAVGPHTWNGQLCNGDAATIAYRVDGAGAITVDSTTPAADVTAEGNRAKVSFGERERVSIRVTGDAPDFTVGVSKKFRCERVAPTVNGLPVPPSADEHGDDDDGDREEHDGDHDEHDGDHDEHDGDHDEHDGDHDEHGDGHDKQDGDHGQRNGDHEHDDD